MNLLIYFCVLLLNINHIAGSSLSTPRILLPTFDNQAVNYTLKALKDNGDSDCYEWSTSRSDIITLVPIYQEDSDCSTEVIVGTKPGSKFGFAQAIVLAHAWHSERVLQCDVVLDSIATISITTTTWKLFMEGVPEDFEVVAFNSKGEKFSTLDGIQFDWNIVDLPQRQPIVRHMPFKGSTYAPPPHIEMLENKGQKGNVILLQGVQIGRTTVTVGLPYEEYKHVPVVRAIITVIANILIMPADVWVMPGDTVQFRVFYSKNGKLEPIELPHHNYYLEAVNESIASCHNTSGNVLAFEEGSTQLVLKSREITPIDSEGSEEDGMKQTSATINVRRPAYIVLKIQPYGSWSLVVGEEAHIVAEIYTNDDHKLFMGIGSKMKMLIENESLFNVENRSQNGTWLSGWTLETGSSTVRAELTELLKPEKYASFISFGKKTIKLDMPIVARQTLAVYPVLKVAPKQVILPWDNYFKPRYDVNLTASGGDGQYVWHVSKGSQLGRVSQNGQVHTFNGPGALAVTVKLKRSPHHQASANIQLGHVGKLEILDYIHTVEVNKTLPLQIALYSADTDDISATELPFTRCNQVPLVVDQLRDGPRLFNTLSDDEALEYIEPVGVACTVIPLRAIELGNTRVYIRYVAENSHILEDSIMLYTFKPLTLIMPPPDEGEVALAVGASIKLVYVGGPKRNADHTVTLRVNPDNEDNIIQFTDVTEEMDDKLPTQSNEYHIVVEILCLSAGTTTMQVSIERSTSSQLLLDSNPLITSTKTRVHCAHAQVLQLKAHSKVTDPQLAASCPLRQQSTRNIMLLPVESTTTATTGAHIEVAAFDGAGRPLLNISTLSLDWRIGKGVAQVSVSGSTSSLPSNRSYGSIAIAHGAYQTFDIVGGASSEQIPIEAIVLGYNRTALQHLSTIEIRNLFPYAAGERKISDRIHLILVGVASVAPATVRMLASKDNVKQLKVSSGSGYYSVKLGDVGVAKMRFLEASNTIEVEPISSGIVQLYVTDLCMPTLNALSATVEVISVSRIEVRMNDRVQVGHVMSATVRLWSSSNVLLDVRELGPIDLEHQFAVDGIVQIEPVYTDERMDVGEIKYRVKGITEGSTKVVFRTLTGLTSDPQQIHVFPALTLLPRNATLLVGGSLLQLHVEGGPQPSSGAHIQFEVDSISPNVVTVASDSGIVTSKWIVGVAKVYARAVGFHSSTGQRVVYAEDSTEVHVVRMNGIRIFSPLTKVRVGAEQPIVVYATTSGSLANGHVSPMILGTMNSVHYSWKVHDERILELRDVFSDMGINYQSQDQISRRWKALKVGHTTIDVTVFLKSPNALGSGTATTTKYSSSIDVEIVPLQQFINALPPGLWSPLLTNWQPYPLVMTLHSELKLETNINVNGAYHLSYTIFSEKDGIKRLDLSHTNRNGTAYSKLVTHTISNDVVTVDGRGILRTGSTYGQALLIVSTSDSGAMVVQDQYYLIHVKPVAYVMMRPHSGWRFRDDERTRFNIPLGAEFNVTAHLYDDLGNAMVGTVQRKSFVFQYERIPGDLTDWRRGENGRSDDAEMVVHTRKACGWSMIRASWKHMEDFIGVRVQTSWEDALEPYQMQTVEGGVAVVVTHGDALCLPNDVEGAIWSSSDASLVQVEQDGEGGYGSGAVAVVVAHINAGGQALLRSSKQPYAAIHVQVIPLPGIKIFPYILHDDDTDGDSSSVARIKPIRTGPMNYKYILPWSTNNTKLNVYKCHFPVLDKAIGCHASFTDSPMSIDIYEVFSIRTDLVAYNQTTKDGVEDVAGWVYACLLTATGAKATQVSHIESDVLVWTTKSDLIRIPLYANVHVPAEIYVDADNDYAPLDIQGIRTSLENVRVQVNDPRILRVDEGSTWLHVKSKDDVQAGVEVPDLWARRYWVQILDYHWHMANDEQLMGLVVYSKGDKHANKVMVRIAGTGGIMGTDLYHYTTRGMIYTIWWHINHYRSQIMITILVTLVLLACLYVHSKYIQPVVNVNVLQNRPAMGGLTLFSHQRAAGSPVGYPITPQNTTYCSPHNASNIGSQSWNLNRSVNIQHSHACENPLNCSCPTFGTGSCASTTPNHEWRRNRRFI